MIRYLKLRRCPRCGCEFAVILLERNAREQSISGFCVQCEHRIEWRLLTKQTAPAGALRSRSPRNRSLSR